MTLTYGELRSNAERIGDADLKQRVLAGIEVLNEKYGPDWVDHVDPAALCQQSTTSCVLGQLFADADDPVVRASWPGRPASPRDGYWKGLTILDGDVADDPDAFGFADGADYDDLTAAWQTALGMQEVPA